MNFTVLLSIYHKEKPIYLRESLNSLFSQSLLPSEIVLVKDGPLTPELEEVISQYLQKYEILKVIALPLNQGLGKALNEGINHCTCELIARMDTDDIAKPNRFERQISIFKEHPEIDVVGAWIDEFEGDTNNIISTRKLPEFPSEIYRFAKKRSPLNHPVAMFRKSAVLNAGGYVHFSLLEDYYLWIRMLMNGSNFYNIPESLLYFRFSSDMFKRRGGWKYAWNELRFQNMIRKMGFITSLEFLYNIILRFMARIMPNTLRIVLYKKVLRR